jgi:hypothetical protein
MNAVGCVLFIGDLLMIAGVEPNPGPMEKGNYYENTHIRAGACKLLHVLSPFYFDFELIMKVFENKNRQEVGKSKEHCDR